MKEAAGSLEVGLLVDEEGLLLVVCWEAFLQLSLNIQLAVGSLDSP